MAQSRLVRAFLLPFLFLVATLVLAIGAVAWRAGQDLTDAVAEKALLEIAARVNQAAERHLLMAHTALKTVVPDIVETAAGAHRPTYDFRRDLPELRERLWLASGLFPSAVPYVFYASADGGFVGISRVRSDFIELRLQQPGMRQRQVYSLRDPDETISYIRKDEYDARTRPWFKGADLRRPESWSPVYIDYTAREPVLTLAKPVVDAQARLLGIAGTDISLAGLSDYLQGLAVSENGVVFIAEPLGDLIATSARELPYRLEGDEVKRLRVEDSAHPLVRQAWEELRQQLVKKKPGRAPLVFNFASAQGTIQVVASRLRDEAGLDWLSVVAVPQPDFLGRVMTGIYQNVALGTLVVLALTLLAALLLWRTVSDIRRIASAAREAARGQPVDLPGLERDDELGDLAHSIEQMDHDLRTDRLTGLLNRDAFFAQLGARRAAASTFNPLRFALLYIDLDRFSMVNDRYGQDAGDLALAEVARRLQHLLREKDLLARYRGDEFIVCLHGSDTEKAVHRVCEKIQWALDAPIRVNEKAGVHLTCSIGAALYPAEGVDIAALVRMADARMCRAKGANAREGAAVVGG